VQKSAGSHEQTVGASLFVEEGGHVKLTLQLPEERTLARSGGQLMQEQSSVLVKRAQVNMHVSHCHSYVAPQPPAEGSEQHLVIVL
jgi:hypothetical protein